MDATSSILFGQGVAAAPMHLGAGASAPQVVPGAGMISAAMGSLLFGVGVPAPVGNMVQPGGYLASAGYSTMPNAMHAPWNGGVAAAGGEQQVQVPAGAGNGVQRPVQHKGAWTEEEDETLKESVKVYGERKWAAISQFLPGRIGKQCRERWTNHLRPGVDKAKSMWTEEDDKALIECHKKFGNRWSMIAKQLEGRSENAVKNHWNATRRSLKAKRRLKKKKNVEAPPGQWTELENYIRTLPAAGAEDLVAPPAPSSDDSPPSSYNLGYGEVVGPNPDPMAPGFDYLAAMGLYHNANTASSSSTAAYLGAMMNNPNVAAPSAAYLELGLNAYYGAAAAQMMGQVEQAAVDAAPYDNNLITYPFIDHLAAWNPAVHADPYAASNADPTDHYCYYGGAGDADAGPSGTAADEDDDGDVVRLASREFLNPSEDDVTLKLAAFM